MTRMGVPTFVPAHMQNNGLMTEKMVSDVKELARNAIKRKGVIIEGTEDLQISDECFNDHDFDASPHFHYDFYVEVEE